MTGCHMKRWIHSIHAPVSAQSRPSQCSRQVDWRGSSRRTDCIASLIACAPSCSRACWAQAAKRQSTCAPVRRRLLPVKSFWCVLLNWVALEPANKFLWMVSLFSEDWNSRRIDDLQVKQWIIKFQTKNDLLTRKRHLNLKLCTIWWVEKWVKWCMYSQYVILKMLSVEFVCNKAQDC